jgi:signal transduction histidine kinase
MIFGKTRSLDPSRPKQVVLGIGLLAIVAVLAGTAYLIFERRASEIHDSERELANLDISLAEQTARAVQSVDLILKDLTTQLSAEGVSDSDSYRRVNAGRDVYKLLQEKIAGVPQLQAISMIDADGNLINFSRAFPTPTLNVADRDYFKALRVASADATYLSEPIENRVGKTWTIFLARRVNGPEGQFLGIVAGLIDLNYFEDLYRALQIGRGSSIALWRRDGMLLARYPSVGTIGQVLPVKFAAESLAFGAGDVYQDRGTVDGVDRVIAARALPYYPIVVSLTMTLSDVLSDWRRQATIIGSGGLLSALLIGLAMWALSRQFGAYEAMTHARSEREEAVRARLDVEAQLGHLQKLEAVGQLSGGIAHDFNNLLSVIQGNIETLKRRLPANAADLHRLADAALRGSERAATLTQRLLAFSRRQPLAPKAVDANKLISGMSEMLWRALGESIAIETALAAGLWRIFADPHQIENALLNLVVNARDAMPEGGKLTIETANTFLDENYAAHHDEVTVGQYVMVAVSDTGTGMSGEIVKHAFEPFFTTKDVGQGTGLGLSQVYGFVKQSGGHVKIYSELGDGTTVKIYLPRQTAKGELADSTAPGAGTLSAAQGETILVVEDDHDVRSYSAEVLRELGYRVFEASDGGTALETIAEHPIDLLFTDVGLPGMNGRQLADEALRRRPALKILFTTGYARNAIVHQGRLDPGLQLIVKPFNYAALAAKIRDVLES